MNYVDLIIIVLVVAAVGRGIMTGAARQVLPFAAALLGLVIGAALAPAASRLVDTPTAKTLVSLGSLFGSALALGLVGEFLAFRLVGVIKRWRLGGADAAIGAVVAVVSTLVTMWLLAGMFSRFPQNRLSSAIHESRIVHALDDSMPPIPSVFSRLGRILNRAGFPDVFAGLEPNPAGPVALPDDPAVRAAVEVAGASTVRVVGDGCGGTVTGSGFVAASDLVVTNAHVVAGISRPFVEDGGGRHRTTVVLFDPDLDVAMLRVKGTEGRALVLRRGVADRGTQGAVLGYPGGGPFKARAGAVLQSFDAVGRDIYGSGLVRRNVYQLRADVRPGNSGGPFVRSNGEVLGVIFSASATDPSVGYALTGKEVGARIDSARTRTAAVSTGRCAA